MANYSNSLMTVSELIDKALGPYKANIVDFKLIHTILHILAKHLKILERRVRVRLDPTAVLTPSNTSLSIKELKLIANVPKKSVVRLAQGSQKSGDKGKIISALHSDVSTKSKQHEIEIVSSDLETAMTPEFDKVEPVNEKREMRPSLLDKIEVQREKVLRVIHQRVDSQEEPDRNPLPMASLKSVGSIDKVVQREKIYIVERVPTALASSKSAPHMHEKRYTEKLSIVTQKEFEELQNEVKELAESLKTIPGPEFPDNENLLLDLKKGASLTDAMSALQLAARLQAVEKAINKIIELLTEIAIIIPPKSDVKNVLDGAGINKLKSGGKDQSPEDTLNTIDKIGMIGPHSKDITTKSPVRGTNFDKSDHTKFTQQPINLTQLDGSTHTLLPTSTEQNIQRVSEEQLWNSLKDLREEVKNNINNVTNRINQVTNEIQRTTIDLEKKIQHGSDTSSHLEEIQNLITKYADKVTKIDTEYSGQLTDFQETLTQMQFELEIGLDNMMEVLASTTGDPAGITELNNKFTSLQHDFDNITTAQKDLHENENNLELNLQSLLYQIELLKEAKCDREEVDDALRDKVGIGALNGLVTIDYFNSVRCDFEKEIALSYEKFYSQEVIWQKAIDELNKHLIDKANISQVESLRHDVNSNLQKLNSKLQKLADIVGEPRAAAVTRKLFRDSACISCSTPAHMDFDEENNIPALPSFKRPPTLGAESGDQPDHEQYGMCQIHHPLPRDHACKRYCGGSHTIIQKNGPALSSDVKVTALQKPRTPNELINSGRACIPCNIHATRPADDMAKSDKESS